MTNSNVAGGGGGGIFVSIFFFGIESSKSSCKVKNAVSKPYIYHQPERVKWVVVFQLYSTENDIEDIYILFGWFTSNKEKNFVVLPAPHRSDQSDLLAMCMGLPTYIYTENI